MSKETIQTNTFTKATYKGIHDGMEFNLAVINQKEKVCQRISEIRSANRLTQQQMCDKINVNIYTYRSYEKGRTEPPNEVLKRIAEAFDISLDYICCRTNNPQGLYNGSKDQDREKQIQDVKYQIEALQSKLNELKMQ